VNLFVSGVPCVDAARLLRLSHDGIVLSMATFLMCAVQQFGWLVHMGVHTAGNEAKNAPTIAVAVVDGTFHIRSQAICATGNTNGN
jgi:hypothetical protein